MRENWKRAHNAVLLSNPAKFDEIEDKPIYKRKIKVLRRSWNTSDDYLSTMVENIVHVQW